MSLRKTVLAQAVVGQAIDSGKSTLPISPAVESASSVEDYLCYPADHLSAMKLVTKGKDRLWKSWQNDFGEAFEAELRMEIQKVEGLKNRRPELNHSIEYQLGEMDGYVEALEQIFRYEQQNHATKSSLAKQSPKAQQVLQCLYEHDHMRHGELATAVDSSYSALTNLMKRVLLSGAVEATRSGKNTYYHLTEAGRQYCKERTTDKREELVRLIQSTIQANLQIAMSKFQSQSQSFKGESQPILRIGEPFYVYGKYSNSELSTPKKIDGIVSVMGKKIVAISNVEEEETSLLENRCRISGAQKVG